MNSSYNNIKARSRLEIVNNTYNGEITPSSLFYPENWHNEDSNAYYGIEETLWKKIWELETEWKPLSLND